MIAWRLMRVCLHLVRGLLTCAFIFPVVNAARRLGHVQRWSRQLLHLCGVQVLVSDRSDGAHAPHGLIVANHVSWLDIFVIDTLVPSRFVAKSDIRSWPLIGWLCASAGTIFIARGRLREVRRIYAHLVDSLRNGEPVAFFPEGTTSEQGLILPFHSNLFESAVEAGVPIQPFALRYVYEDSESFHPAADFVGDMSFGQSMLTILRAKRMKAELIRLPAIDTLGKHRRELAQVTQQHIADALNDRQLGPAE